MKKHLLASIALLATFGGSAMAADMPVKAKPGADLPDLQLERLVYWRHCRRQHRLG